MKGKYQLCELCPLSSLLIISCIKICLFYVDRDETISVPVNANTSCQLVTGEVESLSTFFGDVAVGCWHCLHGPESPAPDATSLEGFPLVLWKVCWGRAKLTCDQKNW